MKNEELREKHFNPKAHILTLLGEELIKSPVMAIYELVKNSYDADAKKVEVYFRDIDDIDKAAIIIEDDGIGMTSEIVENVWLEPGTDNRKPFNKETGEREIIKSPIYDRVPMGEKGVGRFAVHKLGQKILLISRPLLLELDKNRKIIKKELADYEIQLFINWKDFSQSKHLSDIPIKWKIKRDTESFRFKEKSGTYIHLSGLKEKWTKGMARQLKGQTISMLSPKVNETDFRIELNFGNQWLTDFPTAEKIIESAPFKLSTLIDDEYNLDFDYQFELSRNDNIGKNIIKDNPKYNINIKGAIRILYEKKLKSKEYDEKLIESLLNEFDKNKLPFGNLMFEIYSFDLDPNSLRDYTENAAELKRILKIHSGIKVFKGDLRVYDYGEPGNDWLGLDLKRVQNPKNISNNQNIGYVFLDAKNSGNLIEKTNREGFVENSTFELFYITLQYLISQFNATRSSDLEKWKKNIKKEKRNYFEERISNFKTIIEETDLSNKEKREKLLKEAENIEKKYEEDRNTLLVPAGVGMTASIALHEIEKLVPRMEETVKSTPLKNELLKEQVEELKHYTEGIISVLRKGGNKPLKVTEAINRAFDNYKYKLNKRQIKYTIDIERNIDTIICDKRYFITMIMNLIDNSMYWLDTVYKDNKSIFLKAFKKNGFVHIVLADNGPGFKDDISDIVRPFFTRKVDGIGIGMYLIDTIMMRYGKLDIIEDTEYIKELGIPEIYTGAVVELVFNKNQ